jgi:tetratricopeptide (TPR) repeat protein
LDSKRGIADLYYNISILYKQSEQSPLRYSYLCQAESIYRSIEHKPGMAKSQLGLGNYNSTLSRTEIANAYYFEAVALYEELNDISGLSIVCNNLGSNFAELLQYDKAAEYHQRSLSIKMQIGNPNLIGVSHLHISESLIMQHKKEEAIAHLLLAEEYLEKFNNRSDLVTVYGYLRELNEEKGDFEKAYRYSIKFYETRETLRGFEKQSDLALAQSKFELEQRDKEAVLLKKKNAEIEEANRKLQLSNKELAQYAHVASHDLKGHLRMVSVYVDLLNNRMNEKLSEEELKFMEYAIDGSKRMQHLIQDLLELSKNKCSLKNTNG